MFSYSRFKKGFQLIEMLMVLAVIGILIAVSQPLYSHFFIHEKRLEAMAMLTKLALAMEEYHIEHNSYEQASLATLHFPEFIVKNNYQLFITNTTSDDYLLIVKALARQKESDEPCHILSLDAHAKKGVISSGQVDECWQ